MINQEYQKVGQSMAGLATRPVLIYRIKECRVKLLQE
jgi:hypothetical protein